jgi:hypothetical protein
MDSNYDQIIRRLEKLERQAERNKDYIEISNLHGRYNHLLLGHNWDKIVNEMFAKKTPGVTAEIVESGVFHGLEGVKKVFVEMLGKIYNYEGNLALHELTTPVIEVSKDGKTARGMWYTWGANTFYDPVKGVVAIWQVIKYYHKFIKEDGKWKFLEYKAHLVFRSSFNKGWVEEPVIQGSTIKGPDETQAIQSDEPTSYHDPYDPTRDWGFSMPLPPEPEE